MQLGLFLNERERLIVVAALSFMASNIDDMNEAMGFHDEDNPREGKAFEESEVFELSGKLKFIFSKKD